LAGLIARFHGLGWRHRDLYLAHVFVAETPGSQLDLWLIDLQRVFRPRWRPARWRVKDLAQLEFSAAAKGVSTHQRLRFAFEYARLSGLTGRDWIRAVLRKSASIARRNH
jgi:hypothetical protein